MKIAILGTRGIPNTFGGFEQCAEKISLNFVQNGHNVTVYSPNDHSYKENLWKGIKLKRIYSNERNYGFLNPFILDYLALKDAVKQDYDIILELGYSPCALFYYLKKETQAKIITNMAGLEWQRSKWNAIARYIIKYCERIAVSRSDALVSDNYGIQDYFAKNYKRESYYIPYGAELYDGPKRAHPGKYELREYEYLMLVARFQQDNNIETILDGYVLSGSKEPFLVVGNYSGKYGRYVTSKYRNNKNIRFAGGIYDYDILSSLRWYSKIYFHGHSCGGTNPSLLEAMASNAYIAAHDNVFNRHVLKDNGLYFRVAVDISDIIKHYSDDNNRDDLIRNNRHTITEQYEWAKVSERYLEVFQEVIRRESHIHVAS